MAFCYITIPSLENPLNKLQLYIVCAQTAYLNQSLSQGFSKKIICFSFFSKDSFHLGDGFLTMAITLLSDFPKQLDYDGKPILTEKYLYELITNIMSTLVVVPVCNSS